MRKPKSGDLATNHKAHRDFAIEDKYEAGIILKGSELKSIMGGQANLEGAYIKVTGNNVFLHGCHIAKYGKNPAFDHEPLATRKLLLNKSEIRKLREATNIAHRAIVAIKFFWKNNKIKILIGIGTGKNQGDKRQDLKRADARREIERATKG